MPQDFFADGFDQDAPAVVFTKEQDAFLQGKLAFLDPKKTYQISMGSTLNLLKFAGIEKDAIKKIVTNSCSDGMNSKIITYDEMKKIFRGVALKQNRIEPSKINIEANIKTSMPIFHDDSEDEQDDELEDDKDRDNRKTAPKSQQPAPVSSKPQPQSRPPMQQQPSSTSGSSSSNKPPQPQPQSQDPLKLYDAYWKTLKTSASHHNQLIDGSEVKKLCSHNNTDKQTLSKAWKLCNLSEKGYLTKGEYFVFMNLVNSQNIPSALSAEMKNVIQKIEAECGYVKGGTRRQSATARVNTSSSSLNKPAPSPFSAKGVGSSSNVFQKFGQDSNLFDKKPSTQLKKQTSILNPPPQPISSKNSSVVTTSTPSFPISSLIQNTSQLSQQSAQHSDTIRALTENNKQLTAGLSTLQQYLTQVHTAHQQTQQQLQQLKQSQQQLTQRLNSVCISLKNVITKQSGCIQQLKEGLRQENQINLNRLQVLQQYSEEMLQKVDMQRREVDSLVKVGRTGQADKKFRQIQSNQESFAQRLVRQQGQAIDNVVMRRKRQSNEQNDKNKDDQEQKKEYVQNNRRAVDSLNTQLQQQQHNQNRYRQSIAGQQQQSRNDSSHNNDDKNQNSGGMGFVNFGMHLHNKKMQENGGHDQHDSENDDDPFAANSDQQRTSKDQKKKGSQLGAVSSSRVSNKSNSNQAQSHHSPPEHDKSPKTSQSQSQQPSAATSQQVDIQNLTVQQKLKIKQMQLIQMVNYITPIKQQEYAGVVKRITSMTEQQMNTLYAKLYNMYQKRQQDRLQQQKEYLRKNAPNHCEEAQQQGHINSQGFPNANQFNTSQFIDENTVKMMGNQRGGF